MSDPARRRSIASAAAVALVLAACAWSYWPGERTLSIPLRAVSAPDVSPAYPHPVEDLAAQLPGLDHAWVSDFVDLGSDSAVEQGTVAPDAGGETRLFVRSAYRTRSFRIAHPRPEDEVVRFQALGAAPLAARRYVQLAAASGPEGGPRVASLRVRRRVPFAFVGLLLVAAFLLAWVSAEVAGRALRAAAAAVGRALRARLGLALLALVVAVDVTALWRRNWVDPDENFLVGPARELLETPRVSFDTFFYPQPLVYLQAGATAFHALVRAQTGQLAYHDPYTNQLYFGGVPLAPRVFRADSYPLLFFEETTRLLRKLHALFGAAGVFLVYALARRVAGERAGFLAGFALAAQPLFLYQSAQLLPNVPSMLLALALAACLLGRLETARDVLGASLLAGFATAFKYSPVPFVVMLGAVLLAARGRKPVRTAALAFAGAGVGFLAGCPSCLAYPREFVSTLASLAHQYGQAGHAYFEADRVVPAVLHGTYVWWPRYWPNVLVGAWAFAGAALVLIDARRRREWRLAWVLVGTPLLFLAFLGSQLVQFGRNYVACAAFVCLLAGIGAEALIEALGRLAGRRLALAGALACTLALGTLWSELPLGRGQWASRETARERALASLNSSAPLGARVLLVEPSLGQLQGVTPDRARFRTRSSSRGAEIPAAELASADYVVVGGDVLPELAQAPRGRRVFRGPGTSGLPEEYWLFGPVDGRR